MPCDHLIEIADTLAVTRAVYHETQADLWTFGQRGQGDLALRLRRDQHLRLAVVDDRYWKGHASRIV
jgi:hypothetical protein